MTDMTLKHTVNITQPHEGILTRGKDDRCSFNLQNHVKTSQSYREKQQNQAQCGVGLGWGE